MSLNMLQILAIVWRLCRRSMRVHRSDHCAPVCTTTAPVQKSWPEWTETKSTSQVTWVSWAPIETLGQMNGRTQHGGARDMRAPVRQPTMPNA